MGSPQTYRQALEKLCRTRLDEVKLRVELARNFLREIHEDTKNGTLPRPDGEFAYRRAVRAENLALAEYTRILRIFHNLTVNGKVPDGTDWPRPRTAATNGANSANGANGEDH